MAFATRPASHPARRKCGEIFRSRIKKIYHVFSEFLSKVSKNFATHSTVVTANRFKNFLKKPRSGAMLGGRKFPPNKFQSRMNTKKHEPIATKRHKNHKTNFKNFFVH